MAAVALVDGLPTPDKKNVVAFPESVQAKNPAAVALGKLGGSKGGKMRAEKLSDERKKEIARQAAKARWAKEAAAKTEAFLTVPLYAKIYEQFKGANLPPTGGLEAAIGSMGVAPKQKSNARQVFQRAAAQAGFFAYGPGRLVYPPIKGAGPAPAASEEATERTDDSASEKPHKTKHRGGGDGTGGESDLHPFVAGLLKTLPAADSEWAMDARRKWLHAASHIFEVIYKDSESKGSLRIEIQKDSAK